MLNLGGAVFAFCRLFYRLFYRLFCLLFYRLFYRLVHRNFHMLFHAPFYFLARIRVIDQLPPRRSMKFPRASFNSKVNMLSVVDPTSM